MTYKQYYNKIKLHPRFEELTEKYKSDNRYHYVYRITCDEHYYGSRVSKVQPEMDLGITYFTSGKLQKHFAKNISLYKTKIIKVFSNSFDKMIYESYLHQKFNVKEHNSFANKVNQTPFGFDTTGINRKKMLAQAKRKKIMNKIIKFYYIKSTDNYKGIKNSQARTIRIYDKNNKMICEYAGNRKQLLIDFNVAMSELSNSLKNNTPMYYPTTNYILSRLKKTNRLHQIGWKAIYVDKPRIRHYKSHIKRYE